MLSRRVEVLSRVRCWSQAWSLGLLGCKGWVRMDLFRQRRELDSVSLAVFLLGYRAPAVVSGYWRGGRAPRVVAL